MESYKQRVRGIIACVSVCAISFLGASANAATLKQAANYTINTSPDVLITVKERQISDQTLKQARAGYFPAIDLIANYGLERSRNSASAFRTKTLTRRDAGLQLRQLGFDGMGTPNEVDRNEAKIDADAFKIAGTADDVTLLVTQSYLDVLRNQELVNVAQKNLAEHKRIFALIKRRAEGGLGRKADVSQARGRVELATTNFISSQSQLREAKITYYDVVHQTPRALVMPSMPNMSQLPRTQQQALQMALDNHPTLKSAVADVEEAKAQHRVAKAPFMPSVDVVLNADRGEDVGGAVGPADNYSALLQMNYNLFKGGADLARLRETARFSEQAEQIRNQTMREVIESMRLSWNSLKTSQEQLVSLKAHADASRTTSQLYRKQFLLGKRTLLDLLDSENELFDSTQSYVTGRYNVYLSKFRVLNSMGRLTRYLGVALPVGSHAPYQWIDQSEPLATSAIAAAAAKNGR